MRVILFQDRFAPMVADGRKRQMFLNYKFWARAVKRAAHMELANDRS